MSNIEYLPLQNSGTFHWELRNFTSEQPRIPTPPPPPELENFTETTHLDNLDLPLPAFLEWELILEKHEAGEF